jgi:hypothetical protein
LPTSTFIQGKEKFSNNYGTRPNINQFQFAWTTKFVQTFFNKLEEQFKKSKRLGLLAGTLLKVLSSEMDLAESGINR